MEKLFLSEAEAMEALGVRRTLFRELARDHALPVVRLGRRVLYPASAVRQFAEQLVSEAEGSGRRA